MYKKTDRELGLEECVERLALLIGEMAASMTHEERLWSGTMEEKGVELGPVAIWFNDVAFPSLTLWDRRVEKILQGYIARDARVEIIVRELHGPGTEE